tara:strand:+ start:21 stop:572 length:552 start_codon:yes stop_codon:yes gene_type:complete
MIETGFVYRWYDTSNCKFYIGSHKGNPNDGYLGGGVLFRRAYTKRPESFIREIMYTGINYREYEQTILDYEDAASSNEFYNLVNQAWGGSPKGIAKKLSTRLKMSEASKGKPKSNKHRENVSKSLIGKIGANARNKRMVYCEYLNKEFATIRECAEELNMSYAVARNIVASRTNKNKYGITLI